MSTHTSSLFKFCSFATLGMSHILFIRSSMDRHCVIASVPIGRSAPMRLDRPVSLSGAHAWAWNCGHVGAHLLSSESHQHSGLPVTQFGEKRHVQVVSLHFPDGSHELSPRVCSEPLNTSAGSCAQHPGDADVGPRGPHPPRGAGPSLSKHTALLRLLRRAWLPTGHDTADWVSALYLQFYELVL